MEWCYNLSQSIDLLNKSKKSQRRCRKILHWFSLCQHITSPTRKLKTLIDHVISTIPDRDIYLDIFNTEEIFDQDTANVTFNFMKGKYKPRYKFTRNKKLQTALTSMHC